MALKPHPMGLISVAGLRVAEAAFLRSQLFAETGSLTDLFNIKAFIFGVVLYVVYKKTGKHPIIYILASGVIGVIRRFVGSSELGCMVSGTAIIFKIKTDMIRG